MNDGNEKNWKWIKDLTGRLAVGDAQKTCKEYFMNIYNINPEEGNAFTMSSSYSVKTGIIIFDQSS